jgi:hypothetical protein
LYEVKDHILSDYFSGKKLFELKDGTITDWWQGKNLYDYKDGVVSDWFSGKKIVQVQGDISEEELFAVLIDQGLLIVPK